MSSYKKINPAGAAEILNADEKVLALVSAATGSEICVGEAPLIGRYGRIAGKDIALNDPKHEDLMFAYERVESGEDAGKVMRIYIGSEIHGPLLMWSEAGWRNLYGRGNHGVNGACGGTWSCESGSVYPDIGKALNQRDYKVGGCLMHRSAMMEGPALWAALWQIAAMEAGKL
jgi:hypothetical protein